MKNNTLTLSLNGISIIEDDIFGGRQTRV